MDAGEVVLVLHCTLSY